MFTNLMNYTWDCTEVLTMLFMLDKRSGPVTSATHRIPRTTDRKHYDVWRHSTLHVMMLSTDGYLLLEALGSSPNRLTFFRLFSSLSFADPNPEFC